MNLVGNMFVLSRFQIENFEYKEWPKHERHILVFGDFKIVISEYTKLIPFLSHVPRGFRLYPLVPSIKTLMHDRRSVKLMIGTYKLFITHIFVYYAFLIHNIKIIYFVIDVVGRIVTGERIKDHFHFVILLQDVTGHIMQISLYDTRHNDILKTYREIKRKSILYVSRVKLVRQPEWNVLRSTDFSTVVFEPNMPEAHDIRMFGCRRWSPCSS
ncbi:hypothetical protein Hanom_Chr13g01219811 [Helianthus anomalus]